MKKQTAAAKFKNLATKYPYIVAYCNIMGSYKYLIEQQLYLADGMNAPVNTYSVRDGVAHTIDEIKNQQLLNELK